MEHMFAGLFSAWNFSLFDVQESQITVGKIIIAVTLLIFGYFLANKLSLKISKTLSSKFKLPISTAAIVKTVFFYIFNLIILFFVLELLEVPLTIFTVLGAALAIGVSFGSQDIIRNFLSGITVLVEQPVRVGDFVEFDGTHGIIENIGFRSTRLKTGENTHIIVPNSSFLENKVLNWTLSDNVIRGKVCVGVAYGSDLRAVKDNLKIIKDKLDFILDHPKPFYVFADSSLNFEYYFSLKQSQDHNSGLMKAKYGLSLISSLERPISLSPFPNLTFTFKKKVKEIFVAPQFFQQV